jgi:hypothetical protein
MIPRELRTRTRIGAPTVTPRPVAPGAAPLEIEDAWFKKMTSTRNHYNVHLRPIAVPGTTLPDF